jgi:hypothetical protein
VDYGRMAALFVEGIKELLERVENLEKALSESLKQ